MLYLKSPRHVVLNDAMYQDLCKFDYFMILHHIYLSLHATVFFFQNLSMFSFGPLQNFLTSNGSAVRGLLKSANHDAFKNRFKDWNNVFQTTENTFKEWNVHFTILVERFSVVVQYTLHIEQSRITQNVLLKRYCRYCIFKYNLYIRNFIMVLHLCTYHLCTVRLMLKRSG